MYKYRKYLSVIVIILAYYFNINPSKDSPIVHISTGKIQGIVSRSRAGFEFYEYLGIPYAKPPVGDLRFEPPQLSDKWDSLLEVKRYGSRCTQICQLARKVVGSEDCLFLNVFAPKRESFTGLIPVIVFIHGGYFMSGAAENHRPHYFMDNQNVILVNINYRVASLGFMNTEDGIVRGNMGLKDQTLALKWIQENIKAFGGDPNRVVLTGESAGASAVHFHLLSPMSKGLFQKAIMGSGSAIKLWSLSKNPLAQVKRLARKLDCSTSSTIEMVKCLKAKDAYDIIKHHKEFVTPLLKDSYMFVPSIEKTHVGSPDTFLSEHPYEILKRGEIHKVPSIIGLNSEEGLLNTGRFLYDPELVNRIESDWENLSPLLLVYEKERKDLTSKIKNFYFGNGKKINFTRNFSQLTDLFSDRLYNCASVEAAKLQAKYASVYMYFNNYVGEFSLVNFMAISGEIPVTVDLIFRFGYKWIREHVLKLTPIRYGVSHGVSHGDELMLLYMFPIIEINQNSIDYIMSRDLVKLWIQFAYDDTKMKLKNVQWLPVDSKGKSLKLLKFYNHQDGFEAKMIDEPFLPRMEFWKSLNISLS